MVDIIQSDETVDVDILVFPEAILNTEATSIYFSNAFENASLCDNDAVDSMLRNISCATRKTAKYVVINLYIDSNCTEDAIKFNDNRPCSDPRRLTNLNNMALVLDRNGSVISKWVYQLNRNSIYWTLSIFLISDIASTIYSTKRWYGSHWCQMS